MDPKDQNLEKQRNAMGKGIGIGLAIGAGLGVAIGAALGNMAFMSVGIGAGLAIGVALGSHFQQEEARSDDAAAADDLDREA